MQPAWAVNWCCTAIFHARIINKPIIASLETGLLQIVKWLSGATAKKGEGALASGGALCGACQKLPFSRGSPVCPGLPQTLSSSFSTSFRILVILKISSHTKVPSDSSDSGFSRRDLNQFYLNALFSADFLSF